MSQNDPVVAQKEPVMPPQILLPPGIRPIPNMKMELKLEAPQVELEEKVEVEPLRYQEDMDVDEETQKDDIAKELEEIKNQAPRESAEVTFKEKDQIDIKTILEDNEKRAQFEELKQIYNSIPSSSKSLVGYEIDWDTLREKKILDNQVRDFIISMNEKYMGESNQESIKIVDWIVKNLN